MTEKSCPSGDDGSPRRLSTTAVHAGEDRQKLGNSMTDPIFCAATYTFPDTQSVIDFVENKLPREEYSRYGNPSEKVAEQKLAALEGGEAGLIYSSGMSAVAGLLLSKLQSGDEIILFDECYHRTREFCTKHLGKFGVVTHQIPACDYQQMEAAITPATKLLISESPTNPHLSVVDVERFVALGRKHGVETVIDATLATPYNQRPLESGVDYVIHSLTKYLAGHNDMLGGVVIGAREGRSASQIPRRDRHGQRAAQHLSIAPRAEDVRVADAAPQRERLGGVPVSRSTSAGGEGLLSRPAQPPIP